MTWSRKLAAGIAGMSLIGLGILADHEGTRYEAYPDPGYGWVLPTICVGSTTGVRRGDTATPEECLQRLQQDVGTAEGAVRRLVQVPVTQGQFDALVSFTFNVGAGALGSSTLLQLLNRSQYREDCLAVGEQFLRWVYSAGKVLPGLQARRADEKSRWDQGCQEWPETPPAACPGPQEALLRRVEDV